MVLALEFSEIDTRGLHWSQFVDNPSPAHVIELAYPGGRVEYKLMAEAPRDLPQGRQVYWTDPSGTTSSKRYVGHHEVSVINVPAWALEPEPYPDDYSPEESRRINSLEMWGYER